MVITNAISDLDPEKIIYAATFGDPKLYLPEGEGASPDACQGRNLSPYRIYAPNCKTAAGSLGAKRPYQETAWAGKIGLWCRDKDLICGAGIKLDTDEAADRDGLIAKAFASHTSYVSGGQIAAAAKLIVQKLPGLYPEKISSLSNSAISAEKDTVVLFDRTYSMFPYVTNGASASAKDLAAKTEEAGGRVALYVYADYVDEKPVENRSNLGNSAAWFSWNLAATHYNGLAETDSENISLLSAIMTALNEQNWRAGAAKSLVVFTCHSYRDPDHDGTTLRQVVKRTLEIDPVNLYIIGPEDLRDDYANLVDATGGAFYNFSQASALTSSLISRPSVEFPLAEYSGKPGDAFTFSAAVTGNPVKFEWDLDFDGIFETETSTPSISYTYSAEAAGFLQLRVTDAVGSISTGSAHVTVSSEGPKYFFLNYTSSEDNATTVQISETPTIYNILDIVNATVLQEKSNTSSQNTSTPEGASVQTPKTPNAGKL